MHSLTDNDLLKWSIKIDFTVIHFNDWRACNGLIDIGFDKHTQCGSR